MAEFPALPLWTDAYLGDTTHLTTFEHGAYLLLLMVAWRSPGCCLPDDDILLSRYTRMTRDKWRKTRPILASFFDIRDGVWRQRRLSDEFQLLQSKRKQQSEAGNASAKAKLLKRANRASTDVDDPLQRTANETSTPTPTYIPMVPSNEETIGANEDSDAAFWANAKGYLGKSKASLIGQWARDYGKAATAQAITRAQLERPVDPVPFIVGCLRRGEARTGYPPGHSGIPL